MKQKSYTPIILSSVAIITIAGVLIYAFYVKMNNKAGQVDKEIFKVMSSDYDWYAEDYGTTMLNNQKK